MNCKSILFVTTELYGYSAGTPRALRWIRLFVLNNFEITVCRINGFSRVTFLEIKTLVDYDTFLNESNILTSVSPGISVGFISSILRYFKHFLYYDLFVGFFASIFILYYFRQRKYLSRGFATSPSISCVASLFIINYFNRNKFKYTVDMRDAWAMHPNVGGFVFLKKIIERNFLRYANSCATVSKGLANQFRDQYDINIKVCYNIATQVDKTNLLPVNNNIFDFNYINFLYAGNIPSDHFDLDSFFISLSRLKIDCPHICLKIKIHFVGKFDYSIYKSKFPNLTSILVFHRPVDQNHIFNYMNSCDVLLFFAHKGPLNNGIVSTKIFEYFKFKKPIFPFGVDHGSDLDYLFRKVCGKSLILRTPDDSYLALVNCLNSNLETLPIALDLNVDSLFISDYINFISCMD